MVWKLHTYTKAMSCAYEKKRSANIARNKKLLTKLGLDSDSGSQKKAAPRRSAPKRSVHHASLLTP